MSITTLTLNGASPLTLRPYNLTTPLGAYDRDKVIDQLFLQPLFSAAVAGQSVTVTDDAGNTIEPKHLLEALGAVQSTTTLQSDTENLLGTLYTSALEHYSAPTQTLFNDLFVNQATSRAGLPLPGPSVLYTTAYDTIPAAKDLAKGKAANADLFFTAIAFTHAPDTVGFWFRDDDHYLTVRDQIMAKVAPLKQHLSLNNQTLFDAFSKTTLNQLVEGYALRTETEPRLQENSFARLLYYYLNVEASTQENAGTNPTMGILPFSAEKISLPSSIWFVNMERHARASVGKIDRDWTILNNSLKNRVTVLSAADLYKLMAAPRADMAPILRGGGAPKGLEALRSARVIFRRQQPTMAQIVDPLMKVMRSMERVNRSMNAVRVVRHTLTKASRRRPDDPNVMGKTTSNKFLPDLHIYLDNSGSISTENYQGTILALIVVAKKLNIDLWFTSFSHVMTGSARLPIQGKSMKQIWKAFEEIPKVTGGTDFEQVWDYIEASPKRQRELSLMITDFDWSPRGVRLKHPKNLYYAPVATSYWNYIVRYAKEFVRDTAHIDPLMARRLLGMFR